VRSIVGLTVLQDKVSEARWQLCFLD